MKLLHLLSALTLVAASPLLHATPVEYQVNGTLASNGGRFSGLLSLDYDYKGVPVDPNCTTNQCKERGILDLEYLTVDTGSATYSFGPAYEVRDAGGPGVASGATPSSIVFQLSGFDFVFDASSFPQGPNRSICETSALNCSSFDFSQLYTPSGRVPVYSAQFTPIPEPSSIALLGTGVLGVAGAVRRKLRG